MIVLINILPTLIGITVVYFLVCFLLLSTPISVKKITVVIRIRIDNEGKSKPNVMA